MAEDAIISGCSRIEKSRPQTRVEKEAFGPWMLVCRVGGQKKETNVGNHVVSESTWATILEENSTMISTRNETVMKGRKGEIYSIRKVLEAIDGEVEVKGKWVNENFGLKSIGRVLKPNNGGVGFVSKKNVVGLPNMDKLKHTTFRAIETELHGIGFRNKNNLFKFVAIGKETLGKGSNGILKDSFNKRKPPDGKSGYNRQLILDLLSAVEGIVAEGESLAEVSNHDVRANCQCSCFVTDV
ncbi:hypothetical protein Goari_013826 [Gossypium aridum]|uniref:Uncharacterized protein n=1 Tax=Gossypium aridum TaxID=34290 RepID=A0A7J8XG98_GOSAI|nr:hypothetical protein [Gossypium aridum]